MDQFDHLGLGQVREVQAGQADGLLDRTRSRLTPGSCRSMTCSRMTVQYVHRGRSTWPGCCPVPSRRHADGDVDRLLALVARLYISTTGTRAHRARRRDIPSTISRLLTEARRRGIIRISVEDHDPRDPELEEALRRRFGFRFAVVARDLGRGALGARATSRTWRPRSSRSVSSRGWSSASPEGDAGRVGRSPQPAGPADVRVTQLMGTFGRVPVASMRWS